MFKTVDTFNDEFTTLFIQHYLLDPLMKLSVDPRNVIEALYRCEFQLKTKIKQAYQNKPQKKKKAIALLYQRLKHEFSDFAVSSAIYSLLDESFSALSLNDTNFTLSSQELIAFYKEELSVSIEKKLGKTCPSFLLQDYHIEIMQNFAVFDEPQVKSSLYPKINALREVQALIREEKRVPIAPNENYFKLFILSNWAYFNKDYPFAYKFLMKNYSHYCKLFDLKEINNEEQFCMKLSEFLSLEGDESNAEFKALHKQLISIDNILQVICTFTLLFNSIISLNSNRTISFISTSFITQNRSKQMLYNFIKAIASTMLPEWYPLVSFLQGPLIEDYVKVINYPNKGIIEMKEIDQLLLTSRLKAGYLKLKRNKFLKGNLLIDYFQKDHDLSSIALIPLSQNTQSTTCNIMISGFLSEVDNLENKWKGMVNALNANETCYFFNWPAQTITQVLIRNLGSKVISFITRNILFNESVTKPFLISKATSKNAGKLLAFIIASRQLFKHQTINLIGFSLGVNVIKNCIKQLYKIHTEMKVACDDIIQNVLMLAGASVIRERRKKEYAEYYNTIASGRVLNCYSLKDEVLNVLFRIATFEKPIGNDILDLPLSKLENYDFSDIEMGHGAYQKHFDFIIRRIKFNHD